MHRLNYLRDQRRENPVVATRTVEYKSGGRTMVGHLALPDGDGKRPGILPPEKRLAFEEEMLDLFTEVFG
jgi:hypothetical protein